MTEETAARLLLERLGVLIDPRNDRGLRHVLHEVLFIALVAIVSGADDAEAIEEFGETHEAWFRRFLELPHGIPSQDTFLRVFAMLDADSWQTVCRQWADELRRPATDPHIAIDGQTVRRSFDKASGGKAIHMVSAYLTGQGLVLGQVKVDEKENEIVAIPDLLRLLNVRGATVTIDAIGCQREIAAKLHENGANYVLQVKGNHPSLQDNIEMYFADALRGKRRRDDPGPKLERYQEDDADHGRVETRICLLSRDLSWVTARGDWAGLDGIAMMARERTNKATGETSREFAYYIVSHPKATARQIGRTIREHWEIENRLHWTLDMAFDQDGARARVGNAAQNFTILRHMALNLLKTAPGKKKSVSLRRKRCGWDPKYLLTVLTGREVA